MTRSLWLAGGGGIAFLGVGLLEIDQRCPVPKTSGPRVLTFKPAAFGLKDMCGLVALQPSFGTTPFALTSNRVGLPAEFKHISKRRKRNQPGFP